MANAAQMIENLAFTIGREADYPSNRELHERLETIEALSRRGRASAARERVLRELADPRIFGLLTNGDARIERTFSPRLHPPNLPYVGRLAAEARARVPRRQGRRKFYPAAGPASLEYCALIVSLAWQKDAGKRPGRANATAQLICELLWRTAGGRAHRAHRGEDAPDTFATWREHLVAARRYFPPPSGGDACRPNTRRPSSDAAAAAYSGTEPPLARVLRPSHVRASAPGRRLKPTLSAPLAIRLART
jgi:hypothetical protein